LGSYQSAWIIDLGLEGGSAGGDVVALGPPNAIVSAKRSHTRALPARLPQRQRATRPGMADHADWIVGRTRSQTLLSTMIGAMR
jgi:hypothetical protein